MRYLLRVTTDLHHTNADAAEARLVDLRRRAEPKSRPAAASRTSHPLAQQRRVRPDRMRRPV
jgi:hypothetical protein